MTENEYNLRMEIYQIGLKLEGDILEEDQIIRIGKELIAMSRVCENCAGKGEDGDPPDSNGVGGGVGICERCKGNCFSVPNARIERR